MVSAESDLSREITGEKIGKIQSIDPFKGGRDIIGQTMGLGS
jgi:hypothetical protein